MREIKRIEDNMGWFITILGLILFGIGTFFTIYSKSISKDKVKIIGVVILVIGLFFTIYGPTIKKIDNISEIEIQPVILKPQEVKLLSLIYEFQKKFGRTN